MVCLCLGLEVEVGLGGGGITGCLGVREFGEVAKGVQRVFSPERKH